MPPGDKVNSCETAVPFGAWYGDADLTLSFPPGWEVLRADPTDAAEITDEQIIKAFDEPVGTPSLAKLAKGKRSAVIAVDDLTRPTPAHRFLPRVTDELIRGGIAPENIRIIMGAAAHRPMSADEIHRKLGEDVYRRFPPIMHDFVGPDVRWVGWVHGGPVYLNRHFLDADLRIVVGGVIPHGETGFGGGAKMVVPGLAGRLTIAHFHGALPPRPAGQIESGDGKLDRRAWAEEVARHIGVDAAVCAVVNGRRQLAGLYVGDIVQAHRDAARQAANIGRTTIPTGWRGRTDIVVVNAYPLDTDPIQMGKSIGIARKIGAKATVVLNAASDGIFYHGMGMGSGIKLSRLLGNLPRWLIDAVSISAWLRGMIYGVRQPVLAARFCYFSLNHLSYADFEHDDGRRAPDGSSVSPPSEPAEPLVYSGQFPAWGFQRKYSRGRLFRTWEELTRTLANRFGARARVLVFPCAPLQILDEA